MYRAGRCEPRAPPGPAGPLRRACSGGGRARPRGDGAPRGSRPRACRRRVGLGRLSPGCARPERPRSAHRARRSHHCRGDGARTARTIRAARDGEGPLVRRPPDRRACVAGAPTRTCAAAGRRDRDGRGGEGPASAEGRLRRKRLARPTGDPRRAPRTRMAAARPAGRPRRSRRQPARIRQPWDRPWARWGARRGDRRNRARRRRRAVARASGRVPEVRALPPSGRLWAERRDHRGGRPAACGDGRNAALARGGMRPRCDQQLRARGRAPAVRGARRDRRCARLARLARLASAGPLVLPTRRRHRPPRMESLQPARTGLPALLRRCVRHLRPRPAHRTPARGLSGATRARYAARGLDRVRPLHRTAPLARLRARADLLRACKRAGRARDALPARARADLSGRPPDPPGRRRDARVAERVVCRLPVVVRSLRRRASPRTGFVAQGCAARRRRARFSPGSRSGCGRPACGASASSVAPAWRSASPGGYSGDGRTILG